MVRYLLNHTVSVFVSVGLLVALGILAWLNIPTSLLPDIPVPEITVRVSYGNLPASETDRTITAPLRAELMQTAHLRDIDCTSTDGSCAIRMTFDYGTRMDLAYIEAGERVDAAMNRLPRDCPRPTVTRVNAADIPVFTMFVSPSDSAVSNPAAYREICDAVEQAVRPRVEQLPQVSMADVSGVVRTDIVIAIDRRRAAPLGIGKDEVEDAFRAANVDAGSAILRDRGIVYSVRMETKAATPEEIGGIYITKGGRIFRLRDIADVSYGQQSGGGKVFYNGKQAVALNVIKHPGARMANFQKATASVVSALRQQYPEFDFSVTNDQAQLLESTLNSLVQNLWLGLLLTFIVSVVFLRNARLPVIVAISMTAALVISMGVLYLFHISLDIISIVGLILSVGMMIDNSLIVADDITQYARAGLPLDEACVKGTNEVITPMLSSMLTTVTVFLPLVFMDGMTGEVFSDQAYSITLSLAVSYLVAITFLPVLYKSMHGNSGYRPLNPRGDWLERFYLWGTRFVFSHKPLFVGLAAVSVPLCVGLFALMPKGLMPHVDRRELVADIDWGDGATAEEDNAARAARLVDGIGKERIASSAVFVGEQQFMLSGESAQEQGQCRIEFTASPTEKNADSLERRIAALLRRDFPKATFTLAPPASLMEAVFPADRGGLRLKVLRGDGEATATTDEPRLFRALRETFADRAVFPEEVTRIDIVADRLKMERYGVSGDDIANALDISGARLSAAGGMPVAIAGANDADLDSLLENSMVRAGGGAVVMPAAAFVSVEESGGLRQVKSGMRGNYLPVDILEPVNTAKDEQSIASVMRGFPKLDYSLEGSVYQSREMLGSLLRILAVSIVLMYLIMTAQFGSFLQPLILLTEIPVDIAAGLLCLAAFGHSLNIMSAIGLVVTCGIVVNDSILKVDVINRLRSGGAGLETAIHEAWMRRLRAIVMTSLTSIFVFVPVLFSGDIGSEMQKPLAVGMIGSMAVGTLYSLFVVPMLYWMVYRKKTES